MHPPAIASAGSIWGQPIAVQSARTNRFDSDVSTRATIAIMRGLAHRYASDPFVLAALNEAISAGAGSHREIACAIFYWIRAKVQFVEDEPLMYEQFGIPPQDLDKELLIVPPVLLNMPQPMGDCDDFSLLAASMLLAAGLTPYFVTVAADASDRHKFSHIYVCVYLADEASYLCLDAGNRLPLVPPGWESSKVTRKAVWAV